MFLTLKVHFVSTQVQDWSCEGYRRHGYKSKADLKVRQHSVSISISTSALERIMPSRWVQWCFNFRALVLGNPRCNPNAICTVLRLATCFSGIDTDLVNSKEQSRMMQFKLDRDAQWNYFWSPLEAVEYSMIYVLVGICSQCWGRLA